MKALTIPPFACPCESRDSRFGRKSVRLMLLPSLSLVLFLGLLPMRGVSTAPLVVDDLPSADKRCELVARIWNMTLLLSPLSNLDGGAKRVAERWAVLVRLGAEWRLLRAESLGADPREVRGPFATTMRGSSSNMQRTKGTRSCAV